MIQKGKRESFSIQILQLVDASLIWLAFWVASLLRNPIRELLGMPGKVPVSGSLSELTGVMFVTLPLTVVVLELFGFYRHPLRKRAGSSFVQMTQALAVVSLLVGVMVVFLRIETTNSRWILGATAPITMVFLYLREVATKSLVYKATRDEDAREAVIIAGGREEVKEFLKTTPEEEKSEWKIVEQIDLRKMDLDEFEDKIKEASVARVLFLARGTEFGLLAKAIEICELQGVEAWVSASFIRTQIARPAFDVFGGKPMLVLRSTPELSWAIFAKEVMDRVGALVAILLSSPLWVVAAVGIKLSSPQGAVFFKQKRAGRYGKPFWMYKFRTMNPDAEAKLAEVKKSKGNEMSGPVFKLEKDPRVFPFGSWLRKLSIDELPQLLNVLNGDMSLVGPRPLPLYEVDEFERMEHRRRLSVKPGITCEWQAGGRNRITNFEDWVKMDLDYIDNWSLWLDIKLLLKTVPAVLFGRGAK